jgi:hypothetical protein
MISNLEEVSHGNNNRNKAKKEGCSSQYHGVSLKKKLWNCTLRYDGITHSFSYKDELHAAYHHDLLVKKFGLENHNPLNNIECPEDFVIREQTSVIRKNGLPRNIYPSGTKYSCRFQGKLSDKSKSGFDTVEEAVLYRDFVLKAAEEEKIERLNNPYDGVIERNSDGIAIMNILNKQKDIVGVTLVDDDIYCYLMKHEKTLSLNKSGYSNIMFNGKKQPLHRWIMNYDGELKVDHIDNNKLNNQRCNLRLATPKQNSQNKGSAKNSSSKYVGISFSNRDKKWKAQIQKEYLGVFDTEEEAVIARNKRAQELNEQGAFYKIESYDVPTISKTIDASNEKICILD